MNFFEMGLFTVGMIVMTVVFQALADKNLNLGVIGIGVFFISFTSAWVNVPYLIVFIIIFAFNFLLLTIDDF